jgi:hypothetical protein
MMTTDRPANADSVAAAAVDEARAALVAQVGADVVGPHLGLEAEGDGLVTHHFACTQAGYPGWRWAVTIARAVDQGSVTINEVVLLPGGEAIIAPAWVPWRERIKPGDLSPGDLLPVDEDDARLVPAYFDGDPNDTALDLQNLKLVSDEVGLGRSRVLSVDGRELAAQRWHDGDQGPDVPIAQSAPAHCGSCGFLVRLAGPLATLYGVCANEFANADGRVVSFEHGCGAHSETQLRKKQLPPPPLDPVFDTVSRDDLESF